MLGPPKLSVKSHKFESSALAFVCFEISTPLKLELSTLLDLEISSFSRVEISSFKRVEISKQTNAKHTTRTLFLIPN